MSRSYKKTPWSGDHKGKAKKRIANHRVRAWLKRHPEEKLSGGDFKKIYETWDICDYGGIWTWEEDWAWEMQSYYDQLNGIYRWRKPQDAQLPDKKECYRKWYKYHKAK